MVVVMVFVFPVMDTSPDLFTFCVYSLAMRLRLDSITPPIFSSCSPTFFPSLSFFASNSTLSSLSSHTLLPLLNREPNAFLFLLLSFPSYPFLTPFLVLFPTPPMIYILYIFIIMPTS